MPIKQAGKRGMRTSARKAAVNTLIVTKAKKLIKQIRDLAHDQKPEEAEKLLSAAQSAIDKAVKKNVWARNKGSRLKSRISHAIVSAKKTAKK